MLPMIVGDSMSSDSLEWRQARQWLITSQVIPVTHRITKPDVDLVDFARSLRDGVFLCGLLNTLKPGCVPNSDWNPKPLMQVSFVYYPFHCGLSNHWSRVTVECGVTVVAHII